MAWKVVFNTVALLLVALIQNCQAGCKDYNSFTINRQTYNCESAFDYFGILSMCDDEDVNYLCCKSCQPTAPLKGKKMKAEGLFVLDAKSLELFTKEANGDKNKGKKQAKIDAELIITDTNAYYDTLLDYDLDITIYIAKFQTLNYDIVSGKDIEKGDLVDSDLMVDIFGEWLQTNEAGLKDTKYDFAMLLTGYDLKDGVNGIATTERMCQRGKAYGVTQFRGLPDETHTMAHEIAHIFGAHHDPDNYLTVMASSSGADATLDKYKFSKISADAINKYLTSSSKASDCLFNTRSNSKKPKVDPTVYTGHSQDMYYVCERDFGKGSLPCLVPDFYDYGYDSGGVCRQVFCHNPNKASCKQSNPPEGLPCAKGKSCKKGKCKNDPRPELKNVDSKCPLGESQMPSFEKGVTCKDLIKDIGPSECYYYDGECCETCPKYKTGIKGCEYGDEASFKVNGKNYDCAKVLKDYGKKEVCQRDEDFMEWCCETCHDLGY